MRFKITATNREKVTLFEIEAGIHNQQMVSINGGIMFHEIVSGGNDGHSV